MTDWSKATVCEYSLNLPGIVEGRATISNNGIVTYKKEA